MGKDNTTCVKRIFHGFATALGGKERFLDVGKWAKQKLVVSPAMSNNVIALAMAEEMITTIERRNRESELMALAGLHTVSMLDSSFLRESQSPTSRRQGDVERLSTQASSILQMWRELEDEHAFSQAQERVRERLRQRRSVDPNTNMSGSRESDNQGSLEGASESEHDFATWSQEQVGPRNENRDPDHSSREQSPDLGDVDRERVRHIVRGLMDSGISDASSNVMQGNGSPRAEWLGETERERVRIAREWMQMTSQQRGSRSGHREDQNDGLGAQVGRRREGSDVAHGEDQPEHIRRDMLRLRGRQALLDLLVRIERERQGELQGLLEHRAVTDFAHRNRIQSLLRGRFLRNERPDEEERPPSRAVSELNQLRQRQTVSGLREGFRSRLENIVRGQEVQHENHDQSQSRLQESDVNQLPDRIANLDSNTAVQSTHQQAAAAQGSNWQQQVAEDERENVQESNYNESSGWRDITLQDTDRNWQENRVPNWNSEATVNEGGGQSQLEVVHDDRRDNGSREAIENWSEVPSDPPRMRDSLPHRRGTRFHPPDDDNVYSMELRELLSRLLSHSVMCSSFNIF
ncbi:uncharacterized protein LOC111408355, partial [Olea europaea var. sylvestris]|uniref:uncharacterized protein LOC111408355 n=1 Tax=Olea europaea var. sylvestris TaxID=158386 RepID=UPI000C1D3434